MNWFSVIKTLPQMYCKGCGYPPDPTDPVPVKCPACGEEKFVKYPSGVYLRDSGTAEIIKELYEAVDNREKRQRELDLRTQGLKQKFGKFFKRK